MINYTKPYIIKLVTNEKEFIKIQKQLLKNGYQWVDTNKVWTATNLVKYPLYISNLPFTDITAIDKFIKIRKNFNQYDNNILFLDDDYKSFKTILLRKEKLKQLELL